MNGITNKVNRLFLIFILSLLAACNSESGGSGGQGGTNPSGSSPSETPTPSTSPMSVFDLEIGAENSLHSVYNLDIDVDISETSTKRAFISICDNSIAKGDLSKVDFDMCLLKGNLNEGVGEFELRVANHCEELITIIWIMEKDREPLIYTLSHNNQKESYWLIN
ncbi:MULTISPECIES: hypothetical protein [Aliivibrio]|jgi:hypothetical protein|uniref:Lipoprotein n=2 Tax=Aliivibrio logei TaxID=688 RepID=A0A1B9P3P4_ALILO|nr:MULTISPECIES: hypothetical protein [Aliivibrio]MBB1313601.1 hypothetical protein [Aliivibrio sp. SR45-2]OCH23119.1 hypothetical protein A6E04_04250 [Aliivibrio logei]OEF22480.1 hypothetical protein A1Q5_15490 [Aliivibrio logei 5S-186]